MNDSAVESKGTIFSQMFPALFVREENRPWWLWVMLLITTLYLLVEFSFNSRLLDAVGGLSAHTPIDGIEWWGRVLSGFAVALFFWPFLFSSKWLGSLSFIGRALLWAAFTVSVMTLVFVAEKDLVDNLVDHSSPEQRYAAVNLMFLQNALITSDVQIEGLNVSRTQLLAPDGKAFLATLPLMLSSIKDIDQKIKDSKPVLVRQRVDKGYGGLNENFNRYIDTLTQVENSYNHKYLEAWRAHNKSLNDSPKQEQDAWRSYQNKLSRRGFTPYTVPRYAFKRVRSEVQASGVPVPSDWEPADLGAFYAAVARRVRDETESRYRDGMREKVGFVLPIGLTLPQFIARPEIQTQWRESLHYPEGILLRPSEMTVHEFQLAVYEKVIAKITQQKLIPLDAPQDQYGDGMKYEKEGRGSMTAILAPPIALLCSVAGAVTHVFKLLFFGIQIFTRWKWGTWFYKSVGILSIVVLMFVLFSVTLDSKITSQDIYKNYLYDKVVDYFGDKPSVWGYLMATGIRGTVQVQPYVYPIFETIRKTAGDYPFGFVSPPSTP